MSYYEQQLRAFVEQYIVINKEGYDRQGKITNEALKQAFQMIAETVFAGDVDAMRKEAVMEYGIVLPFNRRF